MGRFSASDARLHELRQPKPANAALRQDRPPQSHGSSLGLEHPQSAIRPARREGPTLDVGVIEPPPVPPAQRWMDPPRRPRGTTPASSPWDPTGRMPAQSAAGLLPGTRRCAPHARHPHRIPGDIGSSPAIRRGCRPSRAFANPALRAASRAYRPTSRARGLASAADRGTQAKARSVARLRGSFCESRGLAPADRGEHAARPRARLSKRPRKRPWDGQLRRRKCAESNAAPEAPQERRRGCTRTPRRRRCSGWMRP